MRYTRFDQEMRHIADQEAFAIQCEIENETAVDNAVCKIISSGKVLVDDNSYAYLEEVDLYASTNDEFEGEHKRISEIMRLARSHEPGSESHKALVGLYRDDRLRLIRDAAYSMLYPYADFFISQSQEA